jgi:protein tyrosine/serine phosphatase
VDRGRPILRRKDSASALGPAPERRIGLSGPVNFRDLGGYDTVDGRRVRWRRLFRSDSLSPVTVDDARLLTEELGLLAVVDLRTGRELEREGRGGLADVALHYHHVPLIEEVETDPDGPWERSLKDAYARLLDGSAGRISAALGAIASEVAEHPTVFHCTAGKDRTGIVAALVLALLGVSDEDIVTDYVLTQDVMPEMLERFPRRMLRNSVGRPYPSPIMRAEADTMRHTLAVLAEDYGSAAGWLERAAVDPTVVTKLRTALLN